MGRNIAILLSCLALGACNLLPEERQATAPQRVVTKPIAASPATRQCLSELGQTGARFSAQPDKYFGAGCSTLNAVTIDRLAGDSNAFGLSNMGPVTCPTANALAGWARFGVDRAARQILGSPLERIETYGSYSCRNVAGSSRRSAHATAEAIDVAGFVLADGRRISVKQDWNGANANERRFLRVVQQSACKRFGTVLGPDYNAAHEDHFHLEATGGGYCR
ncbi:extensin family protein [Erythrobacter sp. HKB08]|uniref:extensin family protein n=1 Tax=Erythrobacter sp. HKB08 TaxID=2502843 RepID=UPI001008B20C|nr:extensin family protein [Erythrobacter sp. HKB08]